MIPYYAIAKPNAYLAITGAGIPDISLKKKSIVWPLQRVTRFSITPFDFELELQENDILETEVHSACCVHHRSS